VVFSPRLSRAPALFTRHYKLDRNRFPAGLPAATGLATNAAERTMSETLRSFLATKGVELNPPKSLYYNETEGRLYVRATRDDLDSIEQVVHTLLPVIQPQINITCKFVEVLQDDTRALGFDWFLGNTVLNNPSNGPGAVAPSASNQGLSSRLVSAGSPPFDLNGVLTDPQYRVVVHALDQRDGTEVLAAPSITTLSGRGAECKAVQVQSIVKGVKAQALTAPGILNGAEHSVFEVEPMEFGPVLDVAPILLADGFTVKLLLAASLVQFLGYETNRTNQVTVYVDGKRKQVHPPQAIVRQAKVSSEVNVWDGQTVVLGGLISERMLTVKDRVPVLGGLPLVGGAFRSESRTTQRRNLMVFITPTLVDPAGNRIHSEDEMPFSQKAIPPQPKR
jgi:general secretion pathway protein D